LLENGWHISANPLTVTVQANDPLEPVNGGVIRFVANPAANGASATLSAPSAVIAGGTASVKATANIVVGSYTVSASAGGVPSPATFALSNQAAAGAAVRGGTASLITTADGVNLQSAGSNTDIPGNLDVVGPLNASGVELDRFAALSVNYNIAFDSDSGGFITVADYNLGLTNVNPKLRH
jgi:hypothetical protein